MSAKKEELLHPTRDSKIFKPKNIKLSFHASDFSLDRPLSDKTARIINSLIYHKKLDDDEFKVK